MATQKQKELAALLIKWGLVGHIAVEVATKGRLTQLEITTMIKVLKHVIPITGRVVAAEAVGLGRLAVRGAPRAAMALARSNPYTLAAALLYAGYIKRDEIAEVGAAIADDPRTQAAYEDLLAGGQAAVPVMREAAAFTYGEDLSGLRLGPGKAATRRRVSKANKAVKQGMKWLKEGGRGVSGAVAGALPTAAFKIATKAAGMANPKTKSKPGKGKSIMNKLARRLKKWW